MPVSKLTADCIWNSFHKSGKRHLIITGKRGSGKSSLLAKLFPKNVPGITTWAEREKAVFLRDNLSGETVQIGVFYPALPGLENKMILQSDGFAVLGIPALNRCIELPDPWVTIDEIGYLEVGCTAYIEALLKLFDKKQVAAVVRKQEIPFLKELCDRNDVFIIDLDDPFGNIGCVIMASGFGKRFGTNKLLSDFHGSPLFSRILDATDDIFSQRVVVTRYPEIAQYCEERGIQTILHSLPYRSDTVRLGIEALSNTNRCMFAPADQPLLRRETVVSLAFSSKNDPDNIWRTFCGNTPGSPVIFPKWSYKDLQDLPEGKGGSVIIKKYPERVRTVNARDIYELKDVDTPDDLNELLKIQAKTDS